MISLLLLGGALAATDVQLKTADGQAIHANTTPSAGAKRGVILVHMEGGSSEDWGYLSDRLNRAQLTVIAPDLRGHGKNAHRELTDADFQAMVDDVGASAAWLHKQGVTEVSCVGASVGANLCLRAAARDPQLENVVMLSPGLNIKGVTSGDALQGYGDRPLLLVASQEDSASRTAATVLNNAALGQKHLEMLQNAGRGTKMLNQDANLEGLVLSWLLGTYKLSSGEIVTPKPAAADPGTVETTGKKLPGH